MKMQGKKKVRTLKITRRSKKGKSKRMYFHEGTQDAIIKFQGATSLKEREKIYENDILPAFDKLAENLIFMHGFAKDGTNYEILKSDCVTFLYETLGKFSPDRGTKAFSYFNVVAKNWLIINSKKRIKRRRRNVSLDDQENLSNAQKEQIEDFNTMPSYEDIIIDKEKREKIIKVLAEIKKRVRNEREEACIEAITTIFTNIDEIDMLNKRAVFVYIRELSGLNSKKLSVAMSQIRKHYREITKSEDFFIF
jgi:hypothetical protein